MYKNFNITEEEKQQIMEMHQSHGYKKSINEQTGTKWGNGTLLRLPLGSTANNDSIRIEVEHRPDGKEHVAVYVLDNRKVRSEINNIGNVINVFNQVENLLGSKFGGFGTWSATMGVVDSSTTQKIIELLKSLKVDVKNNQFI